MKVIVNDQSSEAHQITVGVSPGCVPALYKRSTQGHSLVNINADDTMVSGCTLKNLDQN